MSFIGAETSQSTSATFTGALVLNAGRISQRKSILICGMTRGGTSFGASVFVRLGVPFWRPGEQKLRRIFEHKQLKDAFVAGELETVGRLAADFGGHFPVWGWKLPGIYTRFELIGKCVPNPHFVMLFKEPLSVAARKNALTGKETVGRMAHVLRHYQAMATLAEGTEHPCMLISYDRAMANLESFIADAAWYAGVPRYDAATVAAAIRKDQHQYLLGLEQSRQRRMQEPSAELRIVPDRHA
jgi:hypothetical protein